MTLHAIYSSTYVHMRLNDRGRRYLSIHDPVAAAEVEENGDFRCTLKSYFRLWGAPDEWKAMECREGPLHIVLDA